VKRERRWEGGTQRKFTLNFHLGLKTKGEGRLTIKICQQKGQEGEREKKRKKGEGGGDKKGQPGHMSTDLVNKNHEKRSGINERKVWGSWGEKRRSGPSN